jgi:hypothetical protein
MAAGNFGSTILLFRSWRSQERKDASLARQEEATSVSKTQEIYDKLTEVLNRELDKMHKQIADQKTEIEMLHLTVQGYKEKCSICANNDTKK